MIAVSDIVTKINCFLRLRLGLLELDWPDDEVMGCGMSLFCLPIILDRMDRIILIGIIITVIIVVIIPFEEVEIALWIGITVNAVLGVSPNSRKDFDSSSEVNLLFGNDVPNTNLIIDK